MKTILAPLDGSDFAARALPFVRVVAQQQGAQVRLLRAVLTGPGEAAQRAARTELREARTELTRASASLNDSGISSDWVLPNDEAGWAIIDEAATRNVDLIVMSTHGRTGLGRWVYGSVADRVLRGTTAPILLVPPWATFNWPAEPTHFRYLVPLDGSALSERALEPTIALARASGGHVVLLSAVEPPLVALGSAAAYAGFDADAEAEQARGELARTMGRLHAAGVQAEADVMQCSPTEAILDAVRLHRAHLIVMSTHGRGGLTRALLGSVAESILRRAPVPLLLIRVTPAPAEQRVRAPGAVSTASVVS